MLITSIFYRIDKVFTCCLLKYSRFVFSSISGTDTNIMSILDFLLQLFFRIIVTYDKPCIICFKKEIYKLLNVSTTMRHCWSWAFGSISRSDAFAIPSYFCVYSLPPSHVFHIVFFFLENLNAEVLHLIGLILVVPIQGFNFFIPSCYLKDLPTWQVLIYKLQYFSELSCIYSFASCSVGHFTSCLWSELYTTVSLSYII